MARMKTYNIKELIDALNEYRVENPETKITVPKFGVYLRTKGWDIQDHTLRRDEELKRQLEEINKNETDERFNELVTYKTIDVDAFLEKNNNKTKLKEAIINRDRYYADIAVRATEAIHQRNKNVKKMKVMAAEMDRMRDQMKKLEGKLASSQKNDDEIKKKNAIIASLKNILDDYVYPDIANAILKKEGILQVVNSVVNDETIGKKMMGANSDIREETKKVDNPKESNKQEKKSKYSSVDSLLGGFDE